MIELFYSTILQQESAATGTRQFSQKAWVRSAYQECIYGIHFGVLRTAQLQALNLT
jgi:hypothetical protein